VIEVFGGWGYYNLGDEAILAGYLETLRGRDLIRVRSVDPTQTAAAQRWRGHVASEYLPNRVARSSTMLLAGGGYLNGTWVPEIHAKLARLNLHRRSRRLVAHGLELRALDSLPLRLMTRQLLQGSAVALRDDASLDHSRAIGLGPAARLPDGISLLSPHVERYIEPVDIARGKVLLNLLDIGRRVDSHESQVALAGWRRFVVELVDRLGGRALGLVVGGGDRHFQSTLPSLRTVEPTTVRGLVSLIAESDGIVSVRMHPALIGTMLNRPTVSIPYTGKVRPTLSQLELERFILEKLDVDRAMDLLAMQVDTTAQWKQAYQRNSEWLTQQLSMA
jgi:polysaccharide pyruvyl transferase WcaK-like protein